VDYVFVHIRLYLSRGENNGYEKKIRTIGNLVADALGVQNKTVSKWECGQGCPDLSLWPELSNILGVDMKQMMEGEIMPNNPDSGNIGKSEGNWGTWNESNGYCIVPRASSREEALDILLKQGVISSNIDVLSTSLDIFS